MVADAADHFEQNGSGEGVVAATMGSLVATRRVLVS
jgi:hypothetical protein